MEINLWAFLSICVILGIGFATLVLYFNHKKEMKKLEIEALKLK